MSSTNPGAKRKPRDFYATPESSVEQLLRRVPELNIYGQNWLEPAVGDGAIVKAVRKYWPQYQKSAEPYFTGVDIEPQIESSSGLEIVRSNYLLYLPEQKHHVIITNPPFFLAQCFIEHSMNLYEDGYQPVIIMLLRLGLLESKSRQGWWQGKEPDALYVLSERPDFTGGGGDSCAYAWYFWNWHERGIFIL